MTLWLIGYSWVASYMLVWFIVVLARHLQCNNYYWHLCVWGQLVPRCVSCDSIPYHLLSSMGRAFGSHCGIAVNCHVYIALLRIFNNQ